MYFLVMVFHTDNLKHTFALKACARAKRAMKLLSIRAAKSCDDLMSWQLDMWR